MSEPGTILYVVVCCDRHCDDTITVHSTREGADAAIEEFKDDYEMEWVEQDCDEDAGWLRYVDGGDEVNDGPSARIEQTELLV